ncbi:hypothetical protein, partial [Salmonella enterica]
IIRLVGSEMCIRDRASWVVGHRGGDCAPTREALLLAHKNV